MRRMHGWLILRLLLLLVQTMRAELIENERGHSRASPDERWDVVVCCSCRWGQATTNFAGDVYIYCVTLCDAVGRHLKNSIGVSIVVVASCVTLTWFQRCFWCDRAVTSPSVDSDASNVSCALNTRTTYLQLTISYRLHERQSRDLPVV